MDQRRLEASHAAERSAHDAELDRWRTEEHRLRTERDRLRAEVVHLQAELEQARREAVAAEQRCEALEHQLLAAEEEAAPAESAAERLEAAEELRRRAEADARALREELAALRAERGQTAARPAERRDRAERGKRAEAVERPGRRPPSDEPVPDDATLLRLLAEESPGAHALLGLCAAFHDGVVPVGLVRPLVAGQDADAFIDILVRQGLLTGGATPEGVVVVRMRPALQQAVREHVPAHVLVAHRERILGRLSSDDPEAPTEPGHWPWYAAVHPHLEDLGALRSTAPEVAGLVLNCLGYLRFRGRCQEGLRLAERTHRDWRADGDGPGGAHARLDALTAHHAVLLRMTGDFAGAERIEHQELERQAALGGSIDRPERIAPLGGIAADLRGLGRYGEAHRAAERYCAARLRLHGERHRATVIARRGLADSLRLLGRYEEALALDRACVAALRGRLGNPVLRLTMEQRLVCDLRLTGAGQEALDRQRPIAAELRRLFGADNPFTVGAEQELALCEMGQGMEPAGLDRLTDAGQAAEELLGRHAPLTLMIRGNLAGAMLTHGGRRDALERCERSFTDFGTLFGPGHPCTLAAMLNLGLGLGRPLAGGQLAGELVTTAHDGLRAALGEDHPWTVRARRARAGGPADGAGTGWGGLAGAAEARGLPVPPLEFLPTG